MKAAYVIRKAIWVFIISFFLFFIYLSPIQAQDSGNTEPSEKFSREELAQMLAPIALYPDALLSQVLMASTYPIEVIEADRWIRKNQELKGEALDDALLDKEWDPGVKALCHFQQVLALMSERIAETTNIGNAFLAQEDEVMAMIQELRAAAHAQGNLATTSEQKVIVEKETIIIEPADPTVFYVPYYDPLFVYGPWWYPAYPPYYWGPSRVRIGLGISYWPGFYFGFIFGDWGYIDWHRHYIYINVRKRPRYVRHDRWIPRSGRWNHTPRHRRGVAYRDKSTARRYGQYPRIKREFRYDVRGFPEPRERDRRIEGRAGIGRDQRERAIITPDRKKKQRVERERVRIAPQMQEQKRIERRQQEQVRIETQKQDKQRVERTRQERVRIEPQIQERKRVERARQDRVKIEPQRQKRQRVERQQPERRRDTVFNRVEEGGKERESSKRGWNSRQGRARHDRGRRNR